MIIKINAAAGTDFPGVNYNDKKIGEGKGKLMLMKNFPVSINEESSKDDVRNYLITISKNEKVKKPQFHAVISTKFQEHSKEELTNVAENFMQEMGYGNQPFIVVFHNDTENNHVHIVSTRVDKLTGKKINDSYEKLKSQKALAKVMEQLYGKNNEEILNKLLNYKIASIKQLELLLQRNGFKMIQNKSDEDSFNILKNGVVQRTISGQQIVFDNIKNDSRAKQIKAIANKYKELYSNKVFKVEDRRRQESMLPTEKQKQDLKPKIEFESELQDRLRKLFGIDIIFHHKDGLKPFGFSVIDNHTGKVWKGSEVMKMNEIFEFREDVINKNLFEIIKDFNIKDKNTKKILLQILNQKKTNEIQDFMLFHNTNRKNKNTYSEIRNEAKNLIQKGKTRNDKAEILKGEDGTYYAIFFEKHFIGKLDEIVGNKMYQSFIAGAEDKGILKFLETLSKISGTSSGTTKDPAEDELLRRKKRKRRK